MSHFVIVVQLPADEVNGDFDQDKFKGGLDAALGKALAPFDENLSVEPYEVTCYCVKHKTIMELQRQAAEKFGDVEELRDMFSKLKTTIHARDAQQRLLEEISKAEKNGDHEKSDKAQADSRKIDAELQASWEKFINLKERKEFEEKLGAELGPKMTPDEECEQCKGTGVHMSTYNPEQKRITICPGKGKEVDSPSGDEALLDVRARKAIVELLESTKVPGRKVLLLSGLPEGEELKKNAGTEDEMASRTEVRDDHGNVSGHASSPELRMRDLQTSDEKETLGRPLSQDRESTLSFVRKVQHDLGPSGGQLGITRCSQGLPHGPHVVNSEIIGGSQWDWYSIGGRWRGYFGGDRDWVSGKDAKTLLNDNTIPFAILSKDGTWHEKGEMGWFGMVSDEKSDKEWIKEARKVIESFADDDVIVAVDCHI